MITADIFIDMNTADANGTALTSVIMTNGTHGSYSAWNMNPSSPPAGMTITSHKIPRYESVRLPSGSGAYGQNATTRAIAYDHTTANLTNVEIAFSGLTTPRATCFGLITIGPANAGVSSGLFDLIHFVSAFSGQFAVMQLNNGNGVSPGDYFLAIETNPNGVTTHSQSIRVTPGGTYWFNLFVDFNWRPGRTAGTTTATGGSARLGLFHPYTGQLLGYAYSASLLPGTDLCDVLASMQIGNGEAGTSSGATTFFESIGIDFTTARFPILPQSKLRTGLPFPTQYPVPAVPSIPAWQLIASGDTLFGQACL